MTKTDKEEIEQLQKIIKDQAVRIFGWDEELKRLYTIQRAYIRIENKLRDITEIINRLK